MSFAHAMPHLLYSAQDREGKAVQGFVDAPSAAQAREQLLAQGLTGVVLHQEPTVATAAGDLAGLSDPQARELARLRISVMQRPGLPGVMLEIARATWIWIALDLAFLGWGVWTSRPLLVAIAAAAALVPFLVGLWQFRHGGCYHELLKSFSIGDWDEVEHLAARLRKVSGKVTNMEFDLDVRLAAIQARKGHLAPALSRLDPWRARLAGSPGLFESRIASVHAAGEDRAGYVRTMAKAYEASAQDPSRALDLALAHARFGDAAAAGRLLQSIDVSLLPPHAQGFVAWTDGLVRLRTGQPGAADVLGNALAAFLKLSAQPAAWTALAFCTCDHAVALSMAGRKDDARRELAQVWPIVKAHADRALLSMLQADGLAPH
ncbi:MAG: hypothetical protein ABIR26_10500 [Ramlibacter sp.]